MSTDPPMQDPELEPAEPAGPEPDEPDDDDDGGEVADPAPDEAALELGAGFVGDYPVQGPVHSDQRR